MQLPASRRHLIDRVVADIRTGRADTVIVYGAIGAGLGYLGEAISAALDVSDEPYGADQADRAGTVPAQVPVRLVSDCASIEPGDALCIATEFEQERRVRCCSFKRTSHSHPPSHR